MREFSRNPLRFDGDGITVMSLVVYFFGKQYTLIVFDQIRIKHALLVTKWKWKRSANTIYSLNDFTSALTFRFSSKFAMK